MNDAQARCPHCGRKTSIAGDMPHVWYCHDCRMYFDDSDDGDIGYGRPEKRAERKEKLTAQERQRRVSEGMRLAWARRRRA